MRNKGVGVKKALGEIQKGYKGERSCKIVKKVGFKLKVRLELKL